MRAYHVLFIDDDPFMLRALLRTGRRLRPDWQFSLCEHALNWQQELAGQVPDLVLSDYLMPDCSGDQVLQQIQQHYPCSVRALLSGDTTEQVVRDASRFAQFVFAKPFQEKDIATLFEVLERLDGLALPVALRQAAGAATTLPALPALVAQLRQAFSQPEVEINTLADLVSHEPVLAARLLQLANSAFLGFSRASLSVSECIMRLGLHLTEAIVMTVALEHWLAGRCQQHQGLVDAAISRAAWCKKLSHQLSLDKELQEQLYIAAVLTAVGPLCLLAWQQAKPAGSADIPAELLSGYMLTLWGYPTGICQQVMQSETKPEVATALDIQLLYASGQLRQHSPASVAGSVADPALKALLQRGP